MSSVQAIAPSRRPSTRLAPTWSSRDGLIGILLAYALLVMIPLAWRGRRGGRERTAAPAGGRPATGAFGTTRSTDEPRHVQHERAQERGRGREATAPWQIPWRGWKDIFWRTYEQTGEDRLLAVAAGVVFYGLLSLFPAITALVSLYGLFTNPSTISEHISLVAGLLPGGAVDILEEQVKRIASKGETRLGFAFLFGLGLALWSANAGMKAIIDALNVIYDEKEKRGFIKLNLLSLAFTLAGIIAILLAIGAVVVLPLVLSFVGLGGASELLLRALRWPAMLAVVILGLAVLYRFGPSRDHARWQWLSVGSVFTAAAWLASSALLSWYLENFADYGATYGSLGAAIGLMMWMWVSAIVILLGAQLNAEIEHQTARDSTTGAEQPLGERGAAMADTVGAAQ
jgi:membrane protein